MTESTAPVVRARSRERGSATLRRFVLVCVSVVAGMLAFAPTRRHVAAASVLQHLSGPAPNPPVRPEMTTDFVLAAPGGSARARLYRTDGPAYGCLVIGHGVHYRGIDEPRLVRFASELARSGTVVLTPELSDLADYRITRAGADVLASAVHDLRARCSRTVGLLGFSFAGGLSLVAAEDPSVSRDLAYVASVGGYHDLSRVLRFLLSDTVESPTGPVSRKAHEYGLAVLLYEHLDALVPRGDLAQMRAAVQAWLHEDRSRAWALASRCTSPAAEELFTRLASGDAGHYRSTLGPILHALARSSASLSPAGKLAQIPVPVYLLHGLGDSVIPPEETTWAEAELAGHPHRALVTPLIEHVEVSGKPTWRDEWALVDFMSGLL